MPRKTTTAKKSNGGPRAIGVHFSTYFFGKKDKDPVIDALHTLMEDTNLKASEVSKNGGPTLTTISNWIDGPTRRPQNATVESFLRACGYERVIRKADRIYASGKNHKAEAPRVIR